MALSNGLAQASLVEEEACGEPFGQGFDLEPDQVVIIRPSLVFGMMHEGRHQVQRGEE